MTDVKSTLHFLKKSYNLTTEQISDRSGVSVSSIKRMLAGQCQDPTLHVLCGLSKCFGVPLDYFGEDRNRYTMRPEEYELLHSFRTLTPPLQDKIRLEIRSELSKLYYTGMSSHSAQSRRQLQELTDELRTPQIDELIEYIKRNKRREEK